MEPEFNLIESIRKFNEMYGIEYTKTKTDLGVERLQNFKNIFFDELDELTDIKKEANIFNATVMSLDWLGDLMVYCFSECGRWGLLELASLIGQTLRVNERFGHRPGNIPFPPYLARTKEQLTDVFSVETISRKTDLEKMERILYYSMNIIFNTTLSSNIVLNDILKIIMKSNFSKLGEDGKPIIDARGKILKGPNFLPPEPDLEEYLQRNWYT
jgi:hypothetical protein